MERDSSARRNHLVEFSYKETAMYRVQLQTNRPVERSIEEVTLQRVQLQRNHHVESSATNKSSCREIS